MKRFSSEATRVYTSITSKMRTSVGSSKENLLRASDFTSIIHKTSEVERYKNRRSLK